MSTLAQQDPAVAEAVQNEIQRQRRNVVLIASENYASRAVLEATGTPLTNKYAEGYPGKRYYGGCEYVDVVEQLAIDRAKKLFGAGHANVQSHSGATANMSAYFALLEPGDTVMGMRLDMGGHLTHGSKVNFSGSLYNFVSYGVSEQTEMIDYDEVARLAREHKPKVIVCGYTAYPRLIDFPRFRQIADEVGAKLMADLAHIAGLVAAGVHPSSIPYADISTTTTHKTLRGPRGAMIMCGEELAREVDRKVFPYTQGGPLMHAVAGKAVAFGEALQPAFAEYGQSIVDNARVLGTELTEGGLRIVSGGTDNHMLLVDLTPLDITGKDAEEALGRVNIPVNRNAIPYDPKPPRVASGLRLGTPAITTRGFGEDETRQVARWIVQVLSNLGDEAMERTVAEEVQQLTSGFPVPGIDS